MLGVDHVALGSDYDGTVTVPMDTSELAILTDTMLMAGFSEEEIRKLMGDDVKRFLLEKLPQMQCRTDPKIAEFAIEESRRCRCLSRHL